MRLLLTNLNLGDCIVQYSDKELILAVWNKGKIIPGYSKDEWRHDDYGNVIRYNDYGNRDSKYGWEKDHIISVASGGRDHIDNYRPLQWQTNVARN